MGARYDIDELLARIDLTQLADELLGARRGHGTNARWASPTPGHPQTGRTPPMTIRVSPDGRQRFHCWATGAAGTAIDLLTLTQRVDTPAAINALAERAALHPGPPPPRRAASAPPAAGQPNPAIDAYVAMGEHWLWTPPGRGPLRYLTHQRRLDPDTLRANRVGFDPGPRLAPRPAGLPHGPGIILPTFDEHARLVYVQTRSLRPDTTRKYLNPIGALAANPGLSWPLNADLAHDRELIVCEGLIDALTLTGHGYRTVAVLGVGHSGPTIAKALLARTETLILAFDADPAGHQARTKLTNLLTTAGRPVAIWPVPAGHDINSLQHAPSGRNPPDARAAPATRQSSTSRSTPTSKPVAALGL